MLASFHKVVPINMLRYVRVQNILFMLLLIIVDQWSKQFIRTVVESSANFEYVVTPFMSFVGSWNTGISFGVLSSLPHINLVMAALGSAVVLGMFLYTNLNIGWQFLIAGALGNIIDRIIHGAVFDFFYFHYSVYDFAIFNVADVYINIGVFLLLLFSFGKYGKQL